ncbi:MAG: hypothetical protein GY794_13910 [bacterium]|nr:hypothetical protein [bacterium]
MLNNRPQQHKLTLVLLLTAIAICSSPSALAESDFQLGTVYYQVLYTNKDLRDLNKVPETAKGIQSVLRIATIGTDRPVVRRTKTLSTRGPIEKHITPNLTCRTPLDWNGRAWVGSAADRTQQLARVITTRNLGTGSKRKKRPGKCHPVLNALHDLQNKRAFWKLAAIDVEAKMFEHAGTPESGKKRWDLAAVGVIQREIDASITQHREELVILERKGKLGPNFKMPVRQRITHLKPTGKIVPTKLTGKWAVASGIAKPIDEIRILPNRVRVWATPEKTQRRTYHVSMAHAEAGTFGAFYYVAYADTSGDGLPDTQIARSPLAEANKPRQWTSWSFITEEKRVFVGHAWSCEDTAIYCRRARGAEWKNLSREVYIAPILGMLPRRTDGPRITNCRVYSVPTPKPTTQPTTKPAKPKTLPPKK